MSKSALIRIFSKLFIPKRVEAHTNGRNFTYYQIYQQQKKLVNNNSQLASKVVSPARDFTTTICKMWLLPSYFDVFATVCQDSAILRSNLDIHLQWKRCILNVKVCIICIRRLPAKMQNSSRCIKESLQAFFVPVSPTFMLL